MLKLGLQTARQFSRRDAEAQRSRIEDRESRIGGKALRSQVRAEASIAIHKELGPVVVELNSVEQVIAAQTPRT